MLTTWKTPVRMRWGFQRTSTGVLQHDPFLILSILADREIQTESKTPFVQLYLIWFYIFNSFEMTKLKVMFKTSVLFLGHRRFWTFLKWKLTFLYKTEVCFINVWRHYRFLTHEAEEITNLKTETLTNMFFIYWNKYVIVSGTRLVGSMQSLDILAVVW